MSAGPNPGGSSRRAFGEARERPMPEPTPRELGHSRLGPERRPRLGFLGLGWIGRQRLAALAESGGADIVGLADLAPEAAAEAVRFAPEAAVGSDLESLLELAPDGIVIATPSALHARQAITCLDRGIAVFCQKPLGRTHAETQQVIAAARAADRLLGVDFSYRHVRGIAEIHELIRSGELGTVYALDLVFHNAYGPDQPWFYELEQSGGGCVMDLGSHLVDLALWMAGEPVAEIDSRLFRQGRRLPKPISQVEDYAAVKLGFESGAIARIACSWGLSAGQDAVIEFAFYGTRGAAALRNVNGSFFDFTVERCYGTRREPLAGYPDAWGGRALEAWTRRLAADHRYNQEADGLAEVASVLDGIYGWR
jgi:predicted dehydrogenase